MAKTHESRKDKAPPETGSARTPWLKWRTGLQTMILVSIALAVFVGWQVYPAGGLTNAVLWGSLAAASIWAIFVVNVLILRR